MGVLLLPSTRCRCRQQKQLGFLWSDMIVKRLITSSSSSSAAASIQLGQLQDNNISRPLHRSSLEVIMKRVVGIVRIGSAGQLCSFTSAFLTKVLDFLKCEMQFPPFFFFLWFPFPISSLALMLNLWDALKCQEGNSSQWIVGNRL